MRPTLLPTEPRARYRELLATWSAMFGISNTQLLQSTSDVPQQPNRHEIHAHNPLKSNNATFLAPKCLLMGRFGASKVPDVYPPGLDHPAPPKAVMAGAQQHASAAKSVKLTVKVAV